MTLEQFAAAMKAKMELRGKEKNLSMEPWTYYSIGVFRNRLVEEYFEWRETLKLSPSASKGDKQEADELLDIAVLCWFTWESLQKGMRT